MKWYKYPETKPNEASGFTLDGCFVRCETPPLKDFPNYGPIISRKVSLFHNDTWNHVIDGKAIPFSEDCKVTHYMYLDEIPWPDDAPLPTLVYERP